MARWKCPACSYQNSMDLRSCLKRCGTRRPEAAVEFPAVQRFSLRQRERLAPGKAKSVAEQSPLYKAILDAKAASKVVVIG